MDQDFSVAILGIVLSVVFFVVSYRQTIGAKRERIRTANRDLLDAILKRLIQERVEPTKDELGRFLSGFARDRLVRPRDIYSVAELIDGLYSRVLENDYIGADERERILNKLRALSLTPASPVVSLQAIQNSVTRVERSWTALVLGLVSATLATGAAILTRTVFQNQPLFSAFENSRELLVVVPVLSSIAMAALMILRRIGERAEQVRDSKRPIAEHEIEAEVAELLSAQGFDVSIANNSDYDMSFSNDAGRYLLEIKRSISSTSRAQDAIERLSRAIDATSSARGYLVSAEPVPTRFVLMGAPTIRICDLSGFADEIMRLKSAA